MTAKIYRVAQWGTGNVGLHALRAITAHPRMELVALRVFSAAKDGQDAGTLLGTAPLGIIASRGIEATLAARPDCVVYLPDHPDLDEMCALLGAGINIVTALIGFNHPPSMAPDTRRRLEDACTRGHASLYSTGSSPGWSTELLPLTLLALQRRLDCLTITDFADNATRNSPEMLFNLLGFGADPASIDPARPVGTAASTPPTFRALADAIGLPIDDITTSIEYALTRKRETIAAGVVEAGTIGGIRMGVIGLRHGKPLLRRFSTWYVTRNLEPAWELRDSGWRMQVEGDTSLDVSVAFTVAEADYRNYSPGLTAHPVINALRFICDAPPGLLQTPELPVIVPYFGD